jgi:Raf kinase inhibitor-like YbhB/YbcL family protein
MTFALTSTAFAAGTAIPARYTCDGENRSPALSWRDVPDGTAALVLIMDDPDAPSGIFTHWVVTGIPPEATQIPEGVGQSERLANGAVQGRNDFGRTGYGGPCPPPGPAHHYRFTLYALAVQPALRGSPTRQELVRAMQGHTLAQTQLVGLYQRHAGR